MDRLPEAQDIPGATAKSKENSCRVRISQGAKEQQQK